MKYKLSICALLSSDALKSSVMEVLQSETYTVNAFDSPQDFTDFVNREKQSIDCLVLEEASDALRVLSILQYQATLLPAVILSEYPSCPYYAAPAGAASPTRSEGGDRPTESADAPGGALQENPLAELPYDLAILWLAIAQIDQLQVCIDQAIAQFIKLDPQRDLKSQQPDEDRDVRQQGQNFLINQQRRLTQKLKERLGYLGVYYKRNPANFMRHMGPDERQTFLDRLKREYQHIILSYFSDGKGLNQKIDNYVDLVFLADVPVAQVVEIHMDLMEDFAKKLKIEGRSEEILLDYRLTLIDTLANLCEMYRRSIPRDP